MAATLNEVFVIKTFDKEYGGYLYVADPEVCNLSQTNALACYYDTKAEANKAMKQLQEEYPEYEFEVDSLMLEY